MAMHIDLPDDVEIQKLLFQVIANWVPGHASRKYTFEISEFERMNLMMALRFLSALYKERTLELFWTPLLKDPVFHELRLDPTLPGAQFQLAETFAGFMSNVIPGNDGRETPNPSQLIKAQHEIIDCYCLLLGSD